MTSAAPDSPALKCAGLVVRYGELTAVDGLDLEIRRGECFGLLGPNGAGKTTTVEAMEGLIAPNAGTVEILGGRWGGGGRGDRALRARIGVALQETRLPDLLTVAEAVRLFRSFYPAGRSVDEVIAILGLGEKRDARVGKLSGGQRQRLALACALVGAPDILFLDEPTTGLDPQARLGIWDVVEKFIAGGGTVLLTTHYMEEAARLCGRVAIIDHGRLLALDAPAALVRMLGAGQVIEFDAGGALDAADLAGIPGAGEVTRRGATIRVLATDVTAALPAILARARERGVAVSSLVTHQATLDDVFVRLTGRGLRDG